MFIQADQIRKRLTLIFLNKFSTIITTQHVKIQIRREAKSIVEKKNSSSMKIFFNFKFSGKKSEQKVENFLSVSLFHLCELI